MEAIILGNYTDIPIGSTIPVSVPAYEAEQAVIKLSDGYNPYVIGETSTDSYWFRYSNGIIRPLTVTDLVVIGGTTTVGSETLRVVGSILSTGLKLGSTTSVTSILDEDDLVSNSNTSLATQQSIKAYVDSQVGGYLQSGDNISELTNNVGYISIETDPIFVASVAHAIVLQDFVDWTTAYGWGNHASAGYLTTETDPIFTASVAYNITQFQVDYWDNTITLAHTHSNMTTLNGILSTGFGDQFLSDDGTYKSLTVLPTGTDGYVLFNDAGTMGTDSTFYFDKVTSTLTYTDGDIAGYLYFNSTDVYIRNNGTGDLTFFDSNAGLITLSDLITGATSYWTQIGSDIHYSSGKVGINTTTFTESLNVSGNILADNFNSKYYRVNTYNNICIGDTAGDGITTTNLLFIDNNALGTASTFPLIKGDFSNRYVEINGELTLNYGIINFEDANQKIFSDLGYLYVQDQYINTGSPLALISFIDGTYNALKTDFAAYSSVAAITAANISNWNSAYGGIHNPVTIGTANGLSLAAQALSLALASTSITGALSSTDWNTFNNKQATLTADVDYLTPTTASTTYEPDLGNPGTTGYVLSSTDAGVRSWIAVSSGVTPTDDILDWSTDKYIPYATRAEVGTNLSFYSENLVPNANHTGTLVLNGKFVAGSTNSSYNSTALEGRTYGGIGVRGEATAGGAGVLGQTTNGSGCQGTVTSTGYGLVSRITGSSVTTAKGLFINRDSGGVSSTGDLILITDNPSSATISGKVLTATIGATERISLDPRVVDGASAVAYMFDTHNALSTTGAKLISFKNNGTEWAYITNYGQVNAVGTKSITDASNYALYNPSGISITTAGSEKLNISLNATDGASALVYDLRTKNTLSTLGSKIISIKNNTVERFRVTPTTTDIPCGSSTTFATIGGVLKDFYTDASTSGTGETDLYSYTTIANVLSTNNDKLEFKVFINHGAGASSTINFYFGTSFLTQSIGSFTGYGTYVCTIMRISSTVARITVYSDIYGVTTVYSELTSLNFTTTNVVKVTGTNSTGTSTAKFGYVEYKPAAIN